MFRPAHVNTTKQESVDKCCCCEPLVPGSILSQILDDLQPLLQKKCVHPLLGLLLLIILHLRGSQVSRMCPVHIMPSIIHPGTSHRGYCCGFLGSNTRLTEVTPDLVGSWTEPKVNRLIENLLSDEFAAAADGGSCFPAAPRSSSVLLLWLFARPPILLSTLFMVMRVLTMVPRDPPRRKGRASVRVVPRPTYTEGFSRERSFLPGPLLTPLSRPNHRPSSISPNRNQFHRVAPASSRPLCALVPLWRRRVIAGKRK